MLQVETISSETIKPSTPTPSHLTPYKLCLLDQFFGLTYVPQVLFYTNYGENPPKIPIVSRLKESLSQTLSLYYPLAGRVSNTEPRSEIDCNDKGITFVVARVDCSIDDFLQDSARVDHVNEFLPGIPTIDETGRTFDASELTLLAIQVTEFNCGGVAIGSQYLHKVFDGASWGIFLKSWAAFAANRNEDVITPDLSTAVSVFPPCRWAADLFAGKRAVVLAVRTLGGGSDDEKSKSCVGKSFVFTAEGISGLQGKCRGEKVDNPTRIEAISGFIWKHAIAAAAQTASDVSDLTSDESILIHSVNMRPRFSPPLPSAALGNLIIHSVAYSKGGRNDQSNDGDNNPTLELQNLVAEVRKSLSEAKDSEFLSKFQGEEGAEAVRSFKQTMGDIDKVNKIGNIYKFTSWSKLDVFPDFGFGFPVWVGFMGGQLSGLFRNLVVLIENPRHQEIEARLILDEHEMAILQSDSEFLAFAIPTS